jgi:hypothetical protein
MNALFDSAALAIVAYAHVDGATGASTVTNSGVTTTRTSTGSYYVALQTAMSQANCKDFVLVQPTAFTGMELDTAYPLASLVLDQQLTTKQVLLGSVSGYESTAQDCSFSIIILRTTIPTPLDQNGNQTGPS